MSAVPAAEHIQGYRKDTVLIYHKIQEIVMEERENIRKPFAKSGGEP